MDRKIYLDLEPIDLCFDRKRPCFGSQTLSLSLCIYIYVYYTTVYLYTKYRYIYNYIYIISISSSFRVIGTIPLLLPEAEADKTAEAVEAKRLGAPTKQPGRIMQNAAPEKHHGPYE